MNPKLMGWLRAFEEACPKNRKPMMVYDDLVQMGVAKPGTTNQGCDCTIAILELEKNIRKYEKDLKETSGFLPKEDWLVSKTEERIDNARNEIRFYQEIHAEHGEYNKAVHNLLMKYGMQRVRRACLSDLRGPTKTYEDGSVYCRIARKEYGELLSTFLVANPKGWF